MDVTFPPRLDVATLPTRVVPLPRLSAAFGGPNLWLKHDDETGSLLSGNKIRKLQYAVEAAQAAGADTLVTCGGVQSNHCRATAALARRLGLDAVLLLRGRDQHPAEGNLLLSKLVGAEIRFVTPEVYARKDEALRAVAEELRRAGREPYVVAEGCSMPIGSWGYIEAMQEITQAQRTLGVRFASVVHAVGSGGTSAGLELGHRLFDEAPPILGFAVCDDAAYFRELVGRLARETIEAWHLPIEVDPSDLSFVDHSVGLGYGQTRPEELDTLALVARLEGVVLDPVYTGKAMHGLRQEIARGRWSPDEHVLFLHTGGIYGLFPHAADLPRV